MSATAKSRIPKYISEQYKGGARQFKAERRKALNLVEMAFHKLCRGSTQFPTSYKHILRIRESLAAISNDISIKNWGR
jgi:hypothetical protein